MPKDANNSSDIDRTIQVGENHKSHAGLSITSTAVRMFRPKRDVETHIDALLGKHPDSEIHFDGSEQPFAKLESEYEIGHKIAAGGQGTVYTATDKILLRKAAVKSLHKEQCESEERRAVFLTEARVTAQLDHPAIVPVYSINSDGDDGKGLHWSMKLIKGVTFHNYLEEVCAHYRIEGVNAFDEEKALRNRLEIFLKVCDALEYAHSRNVMHCDLKPSNIMIGQYHETYIMDWGIARAITPPPEKYTLSGTPRYLAPEVIDGACGDQRADIFALGAILFEAVYLKCAFDGVDEGAVMLAISEGRSRDFTHRFDVHVSRDLTAIVRKALATDPDKRYQQVKDLSADIRRYLMGLEVSAQPDGVAMKIYRWSRNHSVLMLVLFLVALLVGVWALAYSRAQKYLLSEDMRKREGALNEAFAFCSRAAYQLDEQFLRFEHATEILAADVAFMLEYDKEIHHDHRNRGTAYSLEEFKKRPDDTKWPAGRSKELIDPYSMIYNTTLDTNQSTITERLAPLLRFRTRLLEMILDRFDDYALTSDKKIELMRSAFEAGTPVIRVLFGFSDGLYVAYPACGEFPIVYDPRQRNWYAIAASATRQGGSWTQPYVDSIPQAGLVISCSAPFFHTDGSLYGVCSIDVSIDKLIDVLRKLGNNSSIVLEKAIVTADGKIIVSTDSNFGTEQNRVYQHPEEQAEFKYLNMPDFLEEVRRHKFGVRVVADESGREEAYAYCHIRSVNWFYLERINLNALIARRNAQQGIAK